MDSFPGNSRRPLNQQPSGPSPSPAEEKKLDSVVTGKVIRRKKPLGRRIMDTLFVGEGGVLSYLIREVLVPAVRDTAADFVIQGIEKAAYGEVRSSRRTGGFRGGSSTTRHVSYDRPSSVVRSPMNSSSISAPRRLSSVPATPPMDLQEIIVDTQMTAQVILDKLYETIEEYGAATVANLKELLGETSVYTDHKWGWNEDAVFNMKRVREGYLLLIPDAVDLR